MATGDPVVGATVTIEDSSGKTFTGTKTAADGTFSIPVTGGKPPFMLVAVPMAGINMYSVLPSMDMASSNTQNVNITTITTLVMYELSSGNPASMYSSLAFSTLTTSAVASKEALVRNKIPANAMNPVFNTMSGKFVAAVGGNPSDPYDMALHVLGKITAMSPVGVTLSSNFTYTGAFSTTSGTGSASATPTPTITVSLTDPTTGTPINSISTSNNARVTATVNDANGAAVPNAVVTFTTDPQFGAFFGGANTALTNASGVANVTLTTANTSGGAATLTANAMVAGTNVTGSTNYSVGASTLGLSAISVPAGTLSAYGTASISVNVLNNGVIYKTPMAVKFTSACAANGKATLTSSVTTVNGTANASYLDNGCNNASPGDTITATLLNGTMVTVTLPVGAPALGSIQYVSTVTNPATNPPVITLKGTGGANRSETARVTFKVVDSAGNPVGNTLVNFSLNSSLGGLALSSASAASDPVTGYVVTNVISGTISTTVRVTATAGTLSTQSDQLVISTGIPSQNNFSLSASAHNIEGWAYDGMTTTLTARLADHFQNPVPDGTAVSFTSDGGSVVASCNTVGGVCNSVLTSQALRPGNGRVVVLARATGEEGFTDHNGSGLVQSAADMIDANGVSTDMPEAWVDNNENGIRDANEQYFDFNGNGGYDGPDGKYNGVLCAPGAAICSAQKSIDVRGSQVIVFSRSDADITINGGAPIALIPCNPALGNLPSSFIVTVVDHLGNAMPAGTAIALSSKNGAFDSAVSYVVPDTIGCRSTYPGCPASAGSPTFGDIPVTMESDATFSPTAGCSNNTVLTGTFTITVTTPKGNKTTATATITDF